jgi:hypothetical protein
VVQHAAIDLSCEVRFPNFFEKQLLGSTPTLLTVPHGLAGCARNSGLLPPPPAARSLCRLLRRLEFPLTLRQRQPPFAKGGWGLTSYASKTREAQVLSAGSTMKYFPR